MLSRREITTFERDGVVVLRGAVPRRVAAGCRASIGHRLRALGVDPADPATWTEPVIAVPWPATAGFEAAASVPALTEAYDQLIGRGAWTQVPVIGGTVPVRFPSRRRARDATWHVDGTFARDGQPITSIESPTRGVLCLILLSDIGPDDAPTEIKLGSHLDIPPILAPFGAEGCPFTHLVGALPPATLERPSTFATGRAGDVYLCHPFIVHRASARHRGDRPRVLAQPGMMLHRPFRLDGGRPRAVERALRTAMRTAAPTGPSEPPAAPTPPASSTATRRRPSARTAGATGSRTTSSRRSAPTPRRRRTR